MPKVSDMLIFDNTLRESISFVKFSSCSWSNISTIMRYHAQWAMAAGDPLYSFQGVVVRLRYQG
jgi:hypothetical protein